MATSVPVPTAMPRSAWARAGASLTPSPTTATTRPSRCRRRTTAAFSEGSTSATTSSIPTSAATARAGGRVVARQQHRAQALATQQADRLRAGRADRVGDDHQPAHGAVPGHGDRRPAPVLRALEGRAQAVVEREAPVGQQGRAADDHGVAIDDALDAQALAAREALRRRQRAGIGAGGLGDRPPDGVLRGVLQGAGEAQDLPAVGAGGRDHVDHRHRARRDACRSCRARRCRRGASTRAPRARG